jgi:membrane protease YdiL (CAAX protease family)
MGPDRPEGDIRTYVQSRARALPPLAVALPTLGVVASELALFFGLLQVSLAGHFLTLLLCVGAPLVFTRDLALFQVFALVPVFRLVNLGMPVFVELTVYWFPFVYVPLFPAMYFVLQNLDDIDLDFNPRALALWFVPAVVAGAVLAEFEYRILRPEALITEWTLGQVLVLGGVMLLFVAFVEEVLFRGILQRALTDRIGFWPGILLASFLFGMMHSAYANGFEIAFAALIGFIFGYIYVRTESLLLITLIHGLLNTFLFGYIPIHGSLVGLLG